MSWANFSAGLQGATHVGPVGQHHLVANSSVKCFQDHFGAVKICVPFYEDDIPLNICGLICFSLISSGQTTTRGPWTVRYNIESRPLELEVLILTLN